MLIFQIIWLFLPLGVANISASLSRQILPRWNYPLDFNKQFRGKRIFGSHKTWRGLIFGVGAACLFLFWQKYLFNTWSTLHGLDLIDYDKISWLAGVSMGLGALLGDAAKSFFKRQQNIQPGRPWFPFDQLDWVIGGVLLSWPFLNVSFFIVVAAIILGLFFHLLFKVIGYFLGFDKSII